MRAHAVRTTLLIALFASTLSAQQPSWEAATELYAGGRAEAALNMVAALPREKIRDGAREALTGFRDRRRAQALLALWTEVWVEMERGARADRTVLPVSWPRLACRWSSIVLVQNDTSMNGKKILADPRGTLIQIVQGNRRPSTEFLEAWYSFVLAQLNPVAYYLGEDCLAFAPSAVKRSPGWLLALARQQENAQFFVKEADWPLRVAVDLGQAKEALLKALKLEPTLHEARLRLGHVAILMGNEDDGLRNLGMVVAPMDAKFVYLARMFEAEIFEKRGDLGRAQEAYEQALEAYHAQSAVVGLARVMFVKGHRSQAKTVMLRWLTDAASSPRDPWAEYYYGFEEQLPRYRERLRASVLASDEK